MALSAARRFCCHALTLAMQTEDAVQYRPRFQSPAANRAIADPMLQTEWQGISSVLENGFLFTRETPWVLAIVGQLALGKALITPKLHCACVYGSKAAHQGGTRFDERRQELGSGRRSRARRPSICVKYEGGLLDRSDGRLLGSIGLSQRRYRQSDCAPKPLEAI